VQASPAYATDDVLPNPLDYACGLPLKHQPLVRMPSEVNHYPAASQIYSIPCQDDPPSISLHMEGADQSSPEIPNRPHTVSAAPHPHNPTRIPQRKFSVFSSIRDIGHDNRERYVSKALNSIIKFMEDNLNKGYSSYLSHATHKARCIIEKVDKKFSCSEKTERYFDLLAKTASGNCTPEEEFEFHTLNKNVEIQKIVAPSKIKQLSHQISNGINPKINLDMLQVAKNFPAQILPGYAKAGVQAQAVMNLCDLYKLAKGECPTITLQAFIHLEAGATKTASLPYDLQIPMTLLGVNHFGIQRQYTHSHSINPDNKDHKFGMHTNSNYSWEPENNSYEWVIEYVARADSGLSWQVIYPERASSSPATNAVSSSSTPPSTSIDDQATRWILAPKATVGSDIVYQYIYSPDRFLRFLRDVAIQGVAAGVGAAAGATIETLLGVPDTTIVGAAVGAAAGAGLLSRVAKPDRTCVIIELFTGGLDFFTNTPGQWSAGLMLRANPSNASLRPRTFDADEERTRRISHPMPPATEIRRGSEGTQVRHRRSSAPTASNDGVVITTR